MTQKVKNTLLEALRRYHSFHAGESPLQAWTGLGSPSEYKEVVKLGYMKPVHLPLQPRIRGWYRLTEEGLAVCLLLQNDGYIVRNHEVMKGVQS